MSGYREARTPTVRGKKLKSVELIVDESKGETTVVHHYQNDGLEFHKDREYTFGRDEGSDLVEHLGKFAGIPVAESTETEDV